MAPHQAREVVESPSELLFLQVHVTLNAIPFMESFHGVWQSVQRICVSAAAHQARR